MLRFSSRFYAGFRLKSGWIEPLRVGGYAPFSPQDVMKDVRLREKERITLDPSVGNYGCVVPAGVWHTVEVLEPSVIYEAKDGMYGEDGSEMCN